MKKVQQQQQQQRLNISSWDLNPGRLTQITKAQGKKVQYTCHHLAVKKYFICLYLTYPNVSVLVIWFPVPSCVTVEEAVLHHPVRAAVATLRCYGAHLLPGTEVHL